MSRAGFDVLEVVDSVVRRGGRGSRRRLVAQESIKLFVCGAVGRLLCLLILRRRTTNGRLVLPFQRQAEFLAFQR